MTMMPFSSSEEAHEFIKNQRDQADMHGQDLVHGRADFLDSISSDELLDQLDTIVLQSGNDATFAAYIRGQIAVIRKHKFNTCMCGKNHDKEAEAAFAGLGQTVVAERPDAEQMREYGLEVVATYADGSEHPTGLRCKQCLQPYVSVDDRMLRAPGIAGCGGCQQMSSQGAPADRR